LLFPTVQFAIFFPIVLTLSWLLMPKQRFWKPYILFASYVFYAAADVRFCLLLGGITVANQLAAKAIHASASERRRKWITAAAVTFDLGVLGVFKYYGFFTQNVGDLLDSFGLGMPLPLLSIALPVGVSFFTFQAISYVIDVKRREFEPATLMDVGIYLSFFPHLVAGPIVRAREFIPQLATARDPQHVAVGAGLGLIGLGLVKKVMIADYLGREIVDPAFGVPQAFGGPDLIFAAYAYAAQIYCDFSGYTDIAIGLALLMGFIFPQSFRSPYRALGFRDFWRRWHMTLSRFLRDFLYIPLGGNRKGKVRTYVNLFLTMLLGGLWHGASWTFVLWGGFHGAGLSAEHALGRRVERVPRWLRWFITFNLVVFAWILFRSPDLDLFWTYVTGMFSGGGLELVTIPAVIALLAVIGLQLVPESDTHGFEARLERINPIVLAVALAVLILIVGATVPSQGVPPFIYFAF